MCVPFWSGSFFVLLCVCCYVENRAMHVSGRLGIIIKRDQSASRVTIEIPGPRRRRPRRTLLPLIKVVAVAYGVCVCVRWLVCGSG